MSGPAVARGQNNGKQHPAERELTRAEAGRRKFSGKNTSRSRKARQQKHVSEEDELEELEQGCRALLDRIQAAASTASSQPSTSAAPLKRFDQLPLTRKTLAGLKKSSFVEMTDIQAKSLPPSLCGRDILAAARTGSGKTLAFLIPVLERLYREKWGPEDGLGALILSPTRELAIQIFEVLRKIGVAHTLSAGLVIGGKDVNSEKNRLARMNILVATPGRLLQHMDQTAGFDTDNLQVLVLDEADRCLDMGFENTLDAILENLPKQGRQTLLFSATQTKKIRDLARLSLSSPEYIAVHDQDSKKGLMPANLQQHFMVIPLPQKLSVLFSFIRTHLKSKILVFFSACRQVQFAHETMRRMRPGVSLLCLHGKQKQTKRYDIFNNFTKTQHAVLFATDVAARGLDFPHVDWVIQVDSPEDADTYVHRVGRTARYNAKGNSLMFVLPSEEKGMVAHLRTKSIEPELIKAKDSKVQDISNQLQGLLFQDTELKYLGQKAFVSYVRSVYMQRNKAIFDVTELPLDAYAESLGLAGAPKVKFVKDAQVAKKKALKMAEKEKWAAIRKAEKGEGEGEGEEDEKNDGLKRKTKYDRMFERQNQGVLSEHYRSLVADDEEEEDVSDAGDDRSASSDEEELQSSDEEDLTREQAISGRPARGKGSDSDTSDDEDNKAITARISHDDGEDDFITLKRADHELDEGVLDETVESHLSKRKLQLGLSKKRSAAAGLRGLGEKLTFDEEGRAHKVYEMGDEQSLGDARTAAEQFVLREREVLKQRDVVDKERVREKRREKRMKKRERELEGRRGEDGEMAVLAPIDDRDDGYETPDFDLGDEDEEEKEEEEYRPTAKRARFSAGADLQQDEQTALRLLGV